MRTGTDTLQHAQTHGPNQIGFECPLSPVQGGRAARVCERRRTHARESVYGYVCVRICVWVGVGGCGCARVGACRLRWPNDRDILLAERSPYTSATQRANTHKDPPPQHTLKSGALLTRKMDLGMPCLVIGLPFETLTTLSRPLAPRLLATADVFPRCNSS